jgi:polyphosphate kinase 2 (PPK2 family)
MQNRLAAGDTSAETVPAVPKSDSALPDTGSLLDTVGMDAQLDRDDYDKQLDKWQHRLHDLTWKAWKKKISTVAAFEGWDASGKGGAIRRAANAVDARLLSVVPIAAPTDEERAHHYLWRFWRSLPRAGYARFFDRSWYGRVLVERVEGFASIEEWQRSYEEINEFEDNLVDRGLAVVKFWIHISKDEQLQRFEARKKTPWKMHKITDEDWRNRDRWDEYAAAVDEMVARTNRPEAPWVLVAGNDKRYARVQVVKALVKRLDAVLNGD